MYCTQQRRRFVFRTAFLFVLANTVAFSQSDQLAEQSRHGKELMSQGRFEEAAAIYQQLVKDLPANPGLLLNLALAEEMGGHPESAIPHFQAALRLQPNNIPALTSLAMSHLQMNQPAQALGPLKKVIALNEKDVNVRGMLAGAELSLEHFQAASQQPSIDRTGSIRPESLVRPWQVV